MATGRRLTRAVGSRMLNSVAVESVVRRPQGVRSGELSLSVTMGLLVLAGLAPTVLRVLLQVVGLAPHWQGRDSAHITRFMAGIEAGALFGEAPALFAGGFLIGLASGKAAVSLPAG